jgi:hypothetical protein
MPVSLLAGVRRRRLLRTMTKLVLTLSSRLATAA